MLSSPQEYARRTQVLMERTAKVYAMTERYPYRHIPSHARPRVKYHNSAVDNDRLRAGSTNDWFPEQPHRTDTMGFVKSDGKYVAPWCMFLYATRAVDWSAFSFSDVYGSDIAPYQLIELAAMPNEHSPTDDMGAHIDAIRRWSLGTTVSHECWNHINVRGAVPKEVTALDRSLTPYFAQIAAAALDAVEDVWPWALGLVSGQLGPDSAQIMDPTDVMEIAIAALEQNRTPPSWK